MKMLTGKLAGWLVLSALMSFITGQALACSSLPHESAAKIARRLEMGDIVFIRIGLPPFRNIARDTRTWTNHVGIVVSTDGADPVIAESTFPISRTTTLSRFLRRSEGRRLAVMRMNEPLDAAGRMRLAHAVAKRKGVFYDTGFDIHSHRQFCSRFVHEVVAEATGEQVGQVETLHGLLTENPHADLAFWRFWYLGRIPWERETVTPASILRSPRLHAIFDGIAERSARS